MASRQVIAAPAQIHATQTCPHCGKPVPKYLPHCPGCHEALPESRVKQDARAEKRRQIRRGLLYMLLATVIHYFAGGYSPVDVPLSINPLVTLCLTPLLFLSGLALTLYGLYLLILGC